MPAPRRTRPLALAGSLAALTALGTGGVALAATGTSDDPAGNNGTVKIAPHGEMDGIPQNHPHQGCTFQVEWYGFDAGDDITSTVTFAMQAPTSDVVLGGDEPTTVPVGGDAASGAGTETGADAVQVYTLSFEGEPHPVQGYHVKLTVETPGSIGADVKHKVFWVTGCDDTEPGDEETSIPPTEPTDGETTTEPTEGETSTEPTEGETSTEPTDDTETAGEQASTPPSASPGGSDLEVAGEQAAQGGAAVPTAVDAGEGGRGLGGAVAQLTGSGTGLLVAGLGAVLGLGALLVRWRRA